MMKTILVAAMMAFASAQDTATPSAAPTSAPVSAPAPLSEGDIAIANFALQLEYLEAQFYSYAAYGVGLDEELRGGGPEPIGGQKANLTDLYQVYAEELADNEKKHVELLRSVLGDRAVPTPLIDLGAAFEAAANAAVGDLAPLDPPYSPYYSDSWFLLGAFIFEDVGVTAYNGAAGLIEDKGILGAAASILAVEAYHGGAVRTLLSLIKDDLLDPYPLTVTQGVDAVSNLRAAVGGGKDVSIVVDDVVTVVPADDNALAFARTAEEVLAIVYLGAADTPGGFFPEGLN